MVPKPFTLSLLAIIPAILSAVQASEGEPSNTDKNATASASPMCLMFEDQFEKFNLAHWKHEITLSGGGNGEFQSYTNNRTNSFVEDGVLYLKPTFTANTIGEDTMKSGGRISLWGNDETSCTDNAAGGCERESLGDEGGNYLNPIQSAKIKLDRAFSVSYGKVEISARMPKGDWIWPAIWLMPRHSMYGAWPASGEIDIVETRGNVNYTYGNVTSAGSTLQWGPSMDLNAYMDTHVEVLVNSGNSFSDKFHVWGLEWNSTSLRTYVDNTTLLQVAFEKPFWERHTFPDWATNPWKGSETSAPFDQEFFLIMNVAVGGTNGYFPDDKNKPWKNADPRAVNKFWDRRKYWQPSWGSGNQAALAIDSVKIWTKDQSKCLK
ncbi:concanavalin A-like lectin/glucanase domain-containing protein [Umbelopsis sp. AD052]|nr:concanavalin A-like lectin/glucanase domain-containing protein [Umbelopsis sp. AD052]